MSKKISQQDARQFRRERDEAKEELRRLLNRGMNSYSGTDIGGVSNIGDVVMERVRTACKLGFAVFVKAADNAGTLWFRAVRPGE